MKESGFFSNTEEYEKGLDHYKRQWAPIRGANGWALEGSTNYSKFPSFPEVPERIAETLNSVRFIYVMRHPVERLISHIAHNIANGEIQYKTQYEISDICHQIDVSRYHAQLKRYLSLFPADSIYLVSFDEMVSAPVLVARSICRFLGLDESFSFRVLPAANVRRATRSINLSPAARSEVSRMLAAELCEIETEFGFDTRAWRADLAREQGEPLRDRGVFS